jgi:hypothetical protein
VQSASRVGRPQRPLAPGGSPEQELALALRRLREDSGNPTYRVMAGRAYYSASALARAASGAALPSRDLVLAYVRACGGDQAEWDKRWAAAAARAGQGGELEHDATVARSGQRRRPRWLAVAAVAATMAMLAAGVALLMPGQRHPAPRVAAGSSSPAAPVPVRRQGLLVLAPGQVADLDTMAPGWGTVTAPGTASHDIWLSITDHALHGNENANIAILPAGSAGTFSQCAKEQDYGVTLNAPGIRPGQLVCDITSDNRVALLRITNVRRATSGALDQVTFDVIVWVPLHKT